MNAIETQNLTRRFGRMDAVQGLTMAVPEGSVYALLGPNGAGKSTTIKLMMGLLFPTSGESRVLGVDSQRLAPAQWQQIGYVAEGMELPTWMTVRTYLDYCRAFYPNWDRELERGLLKKMELPEERKLKHLSRGMLMKASLVSSLAYRPKVLVLDEPFSGLDPLVRDEFVHGLLEASAQGEWTVLVSSHDIAEVETLCDWVGVLDQGRLQLAEPTEDLQRRFRRLEIQLGDGRASERTNFIWPESWQERQQQGSRMTLVETRYDAERTERACRERFPEAQVTAQPMALREIFVTLARSAREQRKGISA